LRGRLAGSVLEGGDGLHDFAGDLWIDLFEARFGAGLGFLAEVSEWDGGAVYDVDAFRFGEGLVSAPGLEGAEEADGDDWGGGPDDGESDTGSGGMELAVGAAGTFREEEDGAALEEAVQDGFEAFGAAALAVDWDDVDLMEEGSEDGDGEEGLAGEVMEVALESGADEGGIEVAGVVGGEDDGACGGNVFGVVVATTKGGAGEEAREDPAGAVGEVHEEGRRGRRSSRIRAVVCSAVSAELLMTRAPRGIMRGAVARCESR
jgi:hypothetical protein